MTEPAPSNKTKLILWLLNKQLITEDNQPTFLGHIYISTSLIFTVIISYIIMLIIANGWQKKWLNCPEPQDNKTKVTQEILFIDSFKAENKQQKRLTEQINTINDLSAKHCRIMAFFYTQYYATLSLGATAGIVSLLCTVLISKEGWKVTNNTVINIWITSFFVTLFYLNIAQIFQQQENLKTSQRLYNSYVSLSNEFASTLAIILEEKKAEQPGTKEQYQLKFTTYKELILYTDSQLKELSFISLGFDPTPIINIERQIKPGFNKGNFNSKDLSP